MKTIEITITSKGETSIQTHGFAGGECREASKFLEQALGQGVGETLTAEFYQTVTQGASQSQTA